MSLAIESKSDTEITITWDFSFNADDFSVEYRPLNGDWVVEDNVNKNRPFFKIKRLTPNTTYEILIRAVDASLTSDYCDSEIVATCPAGTEGLDSCEGGKCTLQKEPFYKTSGHAQTRR